MKKILSVYMDTEDPVYQYLTHIVGRRKNKVISAVFIKLLSENNGSLPEDILEETGYKMKSKDRLFADMFSGNTVERKPVSKPVKPIKAEKKEQKTDIPAKTEKTPAAEDTKGPEIRDVDKLKQNLAAFGFEG